MKTAHRNFEIRITRTRFVYNYNRAGGFLSVFKMKEIEAFNKVFGWQSCKKSCCTHLLKLASERWKKPYKLLWAVRIVGAFTSIQIIVELSKGFTSLYEFVQFNQVFKISNDYYLLNCQLCYLHTNTYPLLSKFTSTEKKKNIYIYTHSCSQYPSQREETITKFFWQEKKTKWNNSRINMEKLLSCYKSLIIVIVAADSATKF